MDVSPILFGNCSLPPIFKYLLYPLLFMCFLPSLLDLSAFSSFSKPLLRFLASRCALFCLYPIIRRWPAPKLVSALSLSYGCSANICPEIPVPMFLILAPSIYWYPLDFSNRPCPPRVSNCCLALPTRKSIPRGPDELPNVL